MRAARLVISLAVVACHGPEPNEPAKPDTQLAMSADAPWPCDRPPWNLAPGTARAQCDRPASNLDEVADDLRRAFTLLEQLTRDVIGSREFRAAVERFPQVDARPGADWISGPTLARVYAGELADYHLARTCFQLKPCCGATATTDVVTQCNQVTGAYAAIAIEALVLARVAALPEGRACAINTLAHEWTHAITRHRQMVFLDGGHQYFDEPIVSYTVGAIAQCVYLQRWRPALDLEACVRAAGTHTFRPCSCDPGWLDAVNAGDTSCKDPPPASG